MDIIDRAIARLEEDAGTLIAGQARKWDEFHELLEGRRLFLFGAGAGAAYFLTNYGDKYRVHGIVDNDSSKWGHTIGDYNIAVYDKTGGDSHIYPPTILSNPDYDDIILLITNLTQYSEIMTQLEDYDNDRVFSLLSMELERRNSDPENVRLRETDSEVSIEDYAIACSEKPINPKKIVFFSFENGGRYSDHGKYITESLAGRIKDLDIVWTVNDLNTSLPKGVRPIYIHNWKSVINEAETAAIWVSCDPLPSYLIKREGQRYLQTKHWASVTLKKFYLDDTSYADRGDYYERWSKNGKIMDYILVGSSFDEDSCRRGFGFEGECVYVGSPRSDVLFMSGSSRKKVYEKYNIDSSKRCVLYAPTFRIRKHSDYNESVEAENDMDFHGLTESLSGRFGGEWVILKRLHPQIPKENRGVNEEFTIDAGDYPDSQELVGAADVLISDYSSIMFEPAFVRKPVFLYAPDRADYINGERELLIDYETLPFSIAETFEEMTDNIEDFDLEEYKRNVSEFLDRYGVHEDGHASERAAKFIMELIGEQSGEMNG